MLVLRRHSALLALIVAGLLWGLTVPLSKLVLEWLDGGWLTVVRFALAAPLLAFAGRRALRRACTPRVLFAGAIGYGIVIILQNAGIAATSVSHASLIVGAVPALVAMIAAISGPSSTGPTAWLGFALALVGVGIVAGGGGGGATLEGDAIVLASVTLSRQLRGRPAAPAQGSGPDRGDRGADDRRRPRRAPERRDRGASECAGRPHAADRPGCARALRDARPVRAVRPRPVARGARARGGVPEPRAARRHGGRRAGVRRSVRAAAARGRRGDPARHRALHHAAQAPSRGDRTGGVRFPAPADTSQHAHDFT